MAGINRAYSDKESMPQGCSKHGTSGETVGDSAGIALEDFSANFLADRVGDDSVARFGTGSTVRSWAGTHNAIAD